MNKTYKELVEEFTTPHEWILGKLIYRYGSQVANADSYEELEMMGFEILGQAPGHVGSQFYKVKPPEGWTIEIVDVKLTEEYGQRVFVYDDEGTQRIWFTYHPIDSLNASPRTAPILIEAEFKEYEALEYLLAGKDSWLLGREVVRGKKHKKEDSFSYLSRMGFQKVGKGLIKPCPGLEGNAFYRLKHPKGWRRKTDGNNVIVYDIESRERISLSYTPGVGPGRVNMEIHVLHEEMRDYLTLEAAITGEGEWLLWRNVKHPLRRFGKLVKERKPGSKWGKWTKLGKKQVVYKHSPSRAVLEDMGFEYVARGEGMEGEDFIKVRPPESWTREIDGEMVTIYDDAGRERITLTYIPGWLDGVRIREQSISMKIIPFEKVK